MEHTIQTQKHFNHDKSWFYHLNQIEFDLFITLHYKLEKHYRDSIQAYCNRRRLMRETFGNIIKNHLNLTHKSLAYFGITETDSQDRMHGHILLKKRKDLTLSNDELISGIYEGIKNKHFRIENKEKPRNVEVIKDSKDATNYILKIRTSKEREHSIKENFYYSKNFVEICEYMKAGKW
jgi:hypothetical protein